MSAKPRPEPPPAAPPADGNLWYLMPGGLPRLASEVRGRGADQATAYCHTGETSWTRIRLPANDTTSTGGTEE